LGWYARSHQTARDGYELKALQRAQYPAIDAAHRHSPDAADVVEQVLLVRFQV
jgi:hypothetical protein